MGEQKEERRKQVEEEGKERVNMRQPFDDNDDALWQGDNEFGKYQTKRSTRNCAGKGCQTRRSTSNAYGRGGANRQGRAGDPGRQSEPDLQHRHQCYRTSQRGQEGPDVEFGKYSHATSAVQCLSNKP